MTTDADIGNMALGKLGTRATITSLTENSTEARELNRWYAMTRDGLLRAMDWNFARVYLPLALSGTPPTARWTYSYAYPSDCLKFLRFDIGVATFFPIEPAATFEIGSDGTNRMIWCNIAEATGVYTQRVTDPNRWDPEFSDAFAVALAAMVALPITQKIDLANSLKAEAKAFVERSMADSANEQITNERERVSESISVRGYDWYDPYAWPWGRPI